MGLLVPFPQRAPQEKNSQRWHLQVQRRDGLVPQTPLFSTDSTQAPGKQLPCFNAIHIAASQMPLEAEPK